MNSSFVRCPNGHFFDPGRYELCPFCGAAEAPVSPIEQPLSLPIQQDLPVGWLVVTDGPMAGRDFTIRPGENSVGRDYGAAILLTEDASVAERNHASVFYDAGGNSFSVRPGSKTCVSSVNGRPIAAQAELRGGDKVRFGTTNMVFIPLAGEEFRWQ